MRWDRPTTVFAGLYVVASAVQLYAQVVVLPWLIDLTIAIPMVVLTVGFAVARRGRGWSRTTVFALLGFVFSGLGDGIGSIDLRIKLGCFAVAQLCFVLAWWPFRRGVPSRPAVAVTYLAITAVLVIGLTPAAGALLPAVIAYGVLLGTMAWLASGLGRLGCLGGLTFLVSDALLAGQLFAGWTMPGLGVAIMFSYLLAQALLASAALRESVSGPGPGDC